MVKNGHAVAYKEYSKMFIKFEDEAKKSKKGIWQGEFERPNLWRKKNK
jgi:endonuclease YncB( thermonuclease family)